MKLLYSILSIIGFYVLFAIGKSIFYSFLDHTSTYETIYKTEWIIAGVISVAICMILTKGETLTTCVIAMIASFIAYYMPISFGIVILYNLVIVGCFLYSIWGYDYIDN